MRREKKKKMGEKKTNPSPPGSPSAILPRSNRLILASKQKRGKREGRKRKKGKKKNLPAHAGVKKKKKEGKKGREKGRKRKERKVFLLPSPSLPWGAGKNG